jgi:hypothetical protein
MVQPQEGFTSLTSIFVRETFFTLNVTLAVTSPIFTEVTRFVDSQTNASPGGRLHPASAKARVAASRQNITIIRITTLLAANVSQVGSIPILCRSDHLGSKAFAS